MANGNPRYQGKPLLRLLEWCVLWAIDQLSAMELSTLKEMTAAEKGTFFFLGAEKGTFLIMNRE